MTGFMQSRPTSLAIDTLATVAALTLVSPAQADEAAKDGADRQDDEDDGHVEGGLMNAMFEVGGDVVFAEEGHDDGPGHVEGG